MRRAREAELARLAARRAAAGDAAARRSAVLQARVNIGAVLRQALAQSGVDPAAVAMLRVSDEAAQELAIAADRPEPPAGAATPLAGDPQPDGSAAPFDSKIEELVRRYRDSERIDFARISLAEALAWCLAHPAGSVPPLTRGKKGNKPALVFCC